MLVIESSRGFFGWRPWAVYSREDNAGERCRIGPSGWHLTAQLIVRIVVFGLAVRNRAKGFWREESVCCKMKPPVPRSDGPECFHRRAVLVEDFDLACAKARLKAFADLINFLGRAGQRTKDATVWTAHNSLMARPSRRRVASCHRNPARIASEIDAPDQQQRRLSREVLRFGVQECWQVGGTGMTATRTSSIRYCPLVCAGRAARGSWFRNPSGEISSNSIP